MAKTRRAKGKRGVRGGWAEAGEEGGIEWEGACIKYAKGEGHRRRRRWSEGEAGEGGGGGLSIHFCFFRGSTFCPHSLSSPRLFSSLELSDILKTISILLIFYLQKDFFAP